MGSFGRIAASGVVALILLAAGWAWLGRPQALPDAPSPRMGCLSYAPFRDGETPFDPDFVAPPERVAADLAAMAPYTGCVRTYSVGQGLDAVLPAARAAGIEVLLGLWLGGDPAANEREIDNGIRLANEYADTVRAVIVGNEVLLRRELTVGALAGYIDRVRGSVSVPVTYADVWEFWTRNAPLATHVDLVTVHVLPYWEDEPVAVDDAIPHLDEVLRRVQAAFPGKPLLVGETGWPSAGRIRDDAEPGRVAQARFVRTLLDYAAETGLDYNLVEAFDQGWKRRLEGAVGGHWGVLETGGAPKFPLTGPVREIGRPLLWFAISGGIALLLVVVAQAGARATGWRRDSVAVAGIGAAAALAAGALVRQFLRIDATAIDVGERALELALVLLAAATALAIARWWADDPTRRPDPLSARALLAQPFAGFDAARRLGWLRLGGGLVFLFVTLCVIVDPRYRDLPVATVAIAAVGFMLVALLGRRPAEGIDAGDRLFAFLSGIGGAIVLFREGTANDAGWIWAAAGIAISLGWGLLPGRQREAVEARSAPSTTSSSPAAPISTL